MYTLVVVDMQSTFRAALRDRVRKNCLREIKQAVLDNVGIIFLEYYGQDPTLPELIEPTSSYKKALIETKRGDDGSEEAAKQMRSNKFDTKTIKVVGVNTDCCVASTVRGLTGEFPNATIDVIADACDSDWNHINGIERIKGYANVKVKE